MHIVPAADSTATPGPDSLLSARMARVDGCPACIANYALPRTVRDEEPGFRAFYRCESCRYAWSTAWSDA